MNTRNLKSVLKVLLVLFISCLPDSSFGSSDVDARNFTKEFLNEDRDLSQLTDLQFPESRASRQWSDTYAFDIIGCYADDPVRDMTGLLYKWPTKMSLQDCFNHCQQKNFIFAGAQYSEYCMCGNSFGRYGTSTNCNMACSGNRQQICGGAWANTVMQKSCSVHLKSYGYDDNASQRHGFISVNKRTVFTSSFGKLGNPNYRGINTIVLNPRDCSTTGWQWFDTHGSVDAAEDFVEYLRYVREGTILLGVTADDASMFLSPALRLLKVAGVDVHDVHYQRKFAFVLQKGYPHKTAMRKSYAGGNALELLVTVSGSSADEVRIRVR